MSFIDKNSEGCFIFLDHERSDIYINPSIPSSSSIKTPKLVKFLTFPLCFDPTGNLLVISDHGSTVNCFIPKDIFLESLSKVKTTASILSPTLTKS